MYRVRPFDDAQDILSIHQIVPCAPALNPLRSVEATKFAGIDLFNGFEMGNDRLSDPIGSRS